MGFFSRFKKSHSYQDSTEEVVAMSRLLLDDSGVQVQTPLKQHIDFKKLDFSLESLKAIDSYLRKIHEQRKTLTDDQLIKVIARCGSYAGEVLRKASSKSRYWINFETASSINPAVAGMGNSAGTAYILFAEPDNFIFPLGKVYKFIQNGVQDSLYALAKMVLYNDSNPK